MEVKGQQRTECRLRDVLRHRVDSAAAEIKGEQLLLAGRDEEELRLGIEADDPLERGQAPSQGARDLDQTGQAIEPGHAPLSGEPEGDACGPCEGTVLLANLL